MRVCARLTSIRRACQQAWYRKRHMAHTTPSRVLVPVADGSEDIETVSVVDVLRRAAIDVTVASVEAGRLRVTLARGCKLEADATLAEVSSTAFDMICIPGGMPGAQRISDSADFVGILTRQKHEGRWIAAICAAPAVVLSTHGILDASSIATCHASFADRLRSNYAEVRVSVDWVSKVITSQGPGTSIEWALQCVACLKGSPFALTVAKPMHLPPGFEIHSMPPETDTP
jgi:protein deglycase